LKKPESQNNLWLITKEKSLKITTATALLAASLFVLTQPISAKAKYPDVGSIPVDADFDDYIIPWQSGGKYMGKYALVNTKQGLALCGAGYLKGVDKRANDQMLIASYLKNNGKIVIENLRYFKHYRSKSNFKGAMAKCRLTDIRRKLNKSDNLEWGERKVRFSY
jgi:hypothetical protein